MRHSLEQIEEMLSRKGLPFCFYALAHSSEVKIVAQSNAETLLTQEVLDKNEPVFLYRPFEKDQPIHAIRASYAGDVNGFLWHKFDQLPDTSYAGDIAFPENTIREDYNRAFEDVTTKLVDGSIQKLVLSRVLVQSSGNSPVHVFDQLVKKELASFNYYLRTSDGQTWIGATPETLVKVENEMGHTMSLAGTEKVENSQSLFEDKNMREQSYVTDDIMEKLSASGLNNVSCESPVLHQAANVVHIRSKISFDMSSIDLSAIIKVAETLHPTPAVGGKPLLEVSDVLKKIELHSRGLYTGYLGPVNILGDTHLMVNLRCAQYHEGDYAMYAGGGLVLGSELDKEWEETRLKSKVVANYLV